MNVTKHYEFITSPHLYLPSWMFHVVESLSSLYDDTEEYLKFAGLFFGSLIIVQCLLSVVIYIFHSSKKADNRRKRVLFVTAHPDDECMFFGPTIVKLRRTCDVYLLCLTNGNRYLKGNVRKPELWASCAVLGIPASNITLMNNTEMPDDPECMWNEKKTCRILLDFIEAMNFEEVYTFDIEGVSGHFSHVSVYYGFARMCLNKQVPKYCKVYLLDSVSIVRKYTWFLDAAFSCSPCNDKIFMVSPSNSHTIRKAMKQHASQKTWYRSLYVYLSRYMYINTYKVLEREDVQLVIQMPDYNPFF